MVFNLFLTCFLILNQKDVKRIFLMYNGQKEAFMSKARTVRFDDDVDPLVDRFVEKNDINFNKLVNLAVKEFISKPHTIELEPISADEWNINMKKTYKKHKKAMDELAK
jgi:hypothetical protein